MKIFTLHSTVKEVFKSIKEKPFFKAYGIGSDISSLSRS